MYSLKKFKHLDNNYMLVQLDDKIKNNFLSSFLIGIDNKFLKLDTADLNESTDYYKNKLNDKVVKKFDGKKFNKLNKKHLTYLADLCKMNLVIFDLDKLDLKFSTDLNKKNKTVYLFKHGKKEYLLMKQNMRGMVSKLPVGIYEQFGGMPPKRQSQRVVNSSQQEPAKRSKVALNNEIEMKPGNDDAEKRRREPPSPAHSTGSQHSNWSMNGQPQSPKQQQINMAEVDKMIEELEDIEYNLNYIKLHKQFETEFEDEYNDIKKSLDKNEAMRGGVKREKIAKMDIDIPDIDDNIYIINQEIKYLKEDKIVDRQTFNDGILKYKEYENIIKNVYNEYTDQQKNWIDIRWILNNFDKQDNYDDLGNDKFYLGGGDSVIDEYDLGDGDDGVPIVQKGGWNNWQAAKADFNSPALNVDKFTDEMVKFLTNGGDGIHDFTSNRGAGFFMEGPSEYLRNMIMSAFVEPLPGENHQLNPGKNHFEAELFDIVQNKIDRLTFINQLADESKAQFTTRIYKKLKETLIFDKIKIQLDAGTKKYSIDNSSFITSYASIVDGGSATKVTTSEKEHSGIINGIYAEYFNKKFGNVVISIEANNENVILNIGDVQYTIWGFPVNTLVKWYKSRGKQPVNEKNPISILYSKLTEPNNEMKDKLCIRFMCTLKMIGDQGQAKYVKAVNDKLAGTQKKLKYIFCTRDYLAGIFGFLNDPKNNSTLFFKKELTGMKMYYIQGFDAFEYVNELLANIKIEISEFNEINSNDLNVFNDKDTYDNKDEVIQKLLTMIQEPNKTLIKKYITLIDTEISTNNNNYQIFKMDYLLDPLINNIIILWRNFANELGISIQKSLKPGMLALLELTPSTKDTLVSYKLWSRLIYKIIYEKIYKNIHKVCEIIKRVNKVTISHFNIQSIIKEKIKKEFELQNVDGRFFSNPICDSYKRMNIENKEKIIVGMVIKLASFFSDTELTEEKKDKLKIYTLCKLTNHREFNSISTYIDTIHIMYGTEMNISEDIKNIHNLKKILLLNGGVENIKEKDIKKTFNTNLKKNLLLKINFYLINFESNDIVDNYIKLIEYYYIVHHKFVEYLRRNHDNYNREMESMGFRGAVMHFFQPIETERTVAELFELKDICNYDYSDKIEEYAEFMTDDTKFQELYRKYKLKNDDELYNFFQKYREEVAVAGPSTVPSAFPWPPA